MKALLVVDTQNDFMPGGALAVTDGDKIVPIIKAIRDKFDKVYYTMDWHPTGHCSFAPNGPWPVHCVQGGPGAQLHKDLGIDHSREVDKVFYKGFDIGIDSYSGFIDEKKNSTGLADKLRGDEVTDVYVCGLATDVCVKATAIDGVTEGFNIFLVKDACRAVNVQPGDGDAAIEAMKAAGVKVTTSAEV